jgi:hypothetical protein
MKSILKLIFALLTFSIIATFAQSQEFDGGMDGFSDKQDSHSSDGLGGFGDSLKDPQSLENDEGEEKNKNSDDGDNAGGLEGSPSDGLSDGLSNKDEGLDPLSGAPRRCSTH